MLQFIITATLFITGLLAPKEHSSTKTISKSDKSFCQSIQQEAFSSQKSWYQYQENNDVEPVKKTETI